VDLKRKNSVILLDFNAQHCTQENQIDNQQKWAQYKVLNYSDLCASHVLGGQAQPPVEFRKFLIELAYFLLCTSNFYQKQSCRVDKIISLKNFNRIQG